MISNLSKIEQFFIFIDTNRNKEDVEEYYKDSFESADLFSIFKKTLEQIPDGEFSQESLIRLKDILKFLYKTYKDGYEINNFTESE